MLIRHPTPADAPALTRFISMAESEMVHHFTGTTDFDKGCEALVKYVVSPVPTRYSLDNCLAAEMDGVVAGALFSFPADDQPALDAVLLRDLNHRGYTLERLFFEGEPGSYYLSTMGVDPAYRGRGIGAALMAAAEREAVRRGFARTTLLVSKAKDKARALYERAGYGVFREVRIVDVEYYRMIKELGGER